MPDMFTRKLTLRLAILRRLPAHAAVAGGWLALGWNAVKVLVSQGPRVFWSKLMRLSEQAGTGEAAEDDCPVGALPTASVSYTHLDVYKRQSVGRPGRVRYGLLAVDRDFPPPFRPGPGQLCPAS